MAPERSFEGVRVCHRTLDGTDRQRCVNPFSRGTLAPVRRDDDDIERPRGRTVRIVVIVTLLAMAGPIVAGMVLAILR
jgi:hypothetical protein